MGCGCSKSKRVYEYVAPDGTVTVVNNQVEAARMVRTNGGTWRVRT